MTATVPGIVLAGGESRRLGRDKALVRLGGQRLVDRVADRLAPQVAALAISRHDGLLESPRPGATLLADAAGPRDGPLAGLLAGLDWAARHHPAATHVVTVAVDAPFLPTDFVERLAAALEAAGAQACVADSGGRRHPVACLWPIAARHVLREDLGREGSRRVGLFLDRLRPAVARWPAAPVDPFLNVNTAEDLAAAEAILASSML